MVGIGERSKPNAQSRICKQGSDLFLCDEMRPGLGLSVISTLFVRQADLPTPSPRMTSSTVLLDQLADVTVRVRGRSLVEILRPAYAALGEGEGECVDTSDAHSRGRRDVRQGDGCIRSPTIPGGIRWCAAESRTPV
jgi:hypothetical protein